MKINKGDARGRDISHSQDASESGIAYSYSEGGIYRTGEKSAFSMHGLSFGAGTSWFKSSPKINATTGVTYTLPFLK